MIESLRASIERVTRELHQDPYRPDLLIERALLNAVSGQLVAASEDVAAIRRLGAARALETVLSMVVTGAARVALLDGAFLVTGTELGSSAVDLAITAFRNARREADLFFGPPPCLVLVEFSARLPGFNHATHDVPGVGYVKVSPHATGGDYEQLLAHELAHVYLNSGNRFLDEGIAVFFQSRGNTDRIFLGTGAGAPVVRAHDSPPPFPLRALLAYDGRHDVFFDRLAADMSARFVLYAAGLTLVAYLLDHLRMAGLRALCASLRSTPATAAHPALVSNFVGEDIEALDERLFARPQPRASHQTSANHAPPFPSAATVWGQLSAKELQTWITRLRRSAIVAAAPVLAKSTLARALARRLLDGLSPFPAADLAELRSLVHELRLDARTEERDRMLLEGWLAIVEIHEARTVTARVVNWEKALATFSLALSRFPTDGEVLCATAALHLRGPVEYGADRALAMHCLSKARHTEGWTSYARSMEKQHASRSNDPS